MRTNWYDALVGDSLEGVWRYDPVRDVVVEPFGSIITREEWELKVSANLSMSMKG